MTKQFNSDDPMVAFILAHPRQTVILRNDDAGRADRLENQIFADWIRYLEGTKQRTKAMCWKWMRAGGSKFITLPCMDPSDFDPHWIPPQRDERDHEMEAAE